MRLLRAGDVSHIPPKSPEHNRKPYLLIIGAACLVFRGRMLSARIGAPLYRYGFAVLARLQQQNRSPLFTTVPSSCALIAELLGQCERRRSAGRSSSSGRRSSSTVEQGQPALKRVRTRL